jgi:NAD dependent epimerase/dehydratase
MSGTKILVTGADGFIGSHLVEALAKRGRSVRAFVMYNSLGSRGWLDTFDVGGVEIVAGDIRDARSVREAVRGCSAIMHLASLIAIPYSYECPESYLDTNIRGTLNVLQAVRDIGANVVVHTSTSEVYGTARFVPITEDHPLQGQSPYSASKIAADQMAAAFHASFGVPVVTIRPFNTFGPRQSTRAVIPSIITQIAMGRQKLALGSLHPTRDFNFVSDTVNGFIAASETDAGIGQVINLGSNFEISIGNTVKLIAELMNANVEIDMDAERMRPAGSEVERLWADNAKAKRLLNWEPEYGGLDGFRRAMRKTIDWFSDPKNLAFYRPGYSV